MIILEETKPPSFLCEWIYKSANGTDLIIKSTGNPTMLKQVLLAFLIAVCLTQNTTYPCANQTLDPVSSTTASSYNNKLRMTYGYNVASANWSNPTANETASVTVRGWDVFDNRLILVSEVPKTNSTNTSQISITTTFTEPNMVYKQVTPNGRYIFAFRGDKISSLSIKVTSLASVNGSVLFDFSVFRGGYNNFNNNTCDRICTGRPAFASLNGTTSYEQFVCSSSQESVWDRIFDEVISYF
jgi:hypothetical protein